MFVNKGIVCLAMIKLFFFQGNNLKTFSLMVSMALYTCIRIFCMNTLLVFYSFCQLIVAVQTFAVRDATTQRMTLRAIADPLIFGVRGR